MSKNCNQSAITDIVERIVASGALGVGERQVALLRYLINEELAGRGDQIKAYTIGTDVLGRAATFDPSQDAIVRVEIGRLRKTLDLYFATQGREAAHAIVIDKGTYRPRFTNNDLSMSAAPSGALASPEPSKVATGGRAPRKSPTWAIFGALVLAAAIAATGIFFAFRSADDPAYLEAPLILVQEPEIAGVNDQSNGGRFALQNAQVQALRTRSWLRVSLIDKDDHRTQATLQQPAFHLRTYLAAINDHFLLTAVLEREPSHDVVWTGRLEGEFDPADTAALQRYLGEAVARDLADFNGPLVENVAMRAQTTSPKADTPFRCMVNARRYLRFNGVQQFADAKSCLKRLIDQDPSQNSLRAMLVYLTLEEAEVFSLSPPPTSVGGRSILTRSERREALLNEAEALLDTSMPAERFMLAARLTLAACRGQSDVVRAGLPALRALQTNNPDAYIAMGLLAGPYLQEWPLAISAEARAFSLKANPLPWYQFISAIKAAMDDDPGLALRMLTRLPMNNSAIGNVMIVALGTEINATLRVTNARATLARLGLGDIPAMEALVDDSCYAEAVKSRIKRGLKILAATETAR